MRTHLCDPHQTDECPPLDGVRARALNRRASLCSSWVKCACPFSSFTVGAAGDIAWETGGTNEAVGGNINGGEAGRGNGVIWAPNRPLDSESDESVLTGYFLTVT